jgi:hypothetical protein
MKRALVLKSGCRAVRLYITNRRETARNRKRTQRRNRNGKRMKILVGSVLK